MLSIHYRRMCQCVCGNTQPHRSVSSPYSPSFNISFHPVTVPFCASCVYVCEGGIQFYTTQLSVRREGARVSVSVSKSPELLKPYPDSLASYPRLCRRPVDPSRWSSRRASQAQWPLLTEALWCLPPFERVCVCFSPSSAQLSPQCLSSIPLCRPRQEPPPQEFQEPVGTS